MHGQVPALQLGHLLAEPSLGLRLVTGGVGAKRREIVGVHAIEVERPAQWLAPGWMMLTTGGLLRRRPQEQRRLIRELHDNGISALGFGSGVSHDHVPDALVQEARLLDFAVVEVPHETPFRDVVSHVNRTLLVREYREGESVATLHRQLFETLADAEPDAKLMRKLGIRLDADVALFGVGGSVELFHGRPPVEGVWNHLCGFSSSMQLVEFEMARRQVLAVAVSAGPDEAPRWLVAWPRYNPGTTHLLRPAMRAGAGLFAAIRRIDDLAAQRDRTQRGTLLAALLEGSVERHEVVAIAHGYGFDFSAPVHLVALEMPGNGPGRADTTRLLAERCNRALAGRAALLGLPHLVTTHPEGVLALVQAPREQLRTLVQQLALSNSCIGGVGSPVAALADVPMALREALTSRSSIDRALLGPQDDRVVFFSDCSLDSLIISHARVEQGLREAARRRLAPLSSVPELNRTLASYFENDLDVNATARALFIHANTLRNRLARIEELLEANLRQPSAIAELHIALTLTKT